MCSKSFAALLIVCAVVHVACGSESSSPEDSKGASVPTDAGAESSSTPSPCTCTSTETCVRLTSGTGTSMGHKCLVAPSTCAKASGKCSDECKRFFCDGVPLDAGSDSGVTPWTACGHSSSTEVYCDGQ